MGASAAAAVAAALRTHEKYIRRKIYSTNNDDGERRSIVIERGNLTLRCVIVADRPTKGEPFDDQPPRWMPPATSETTERTAAGMKKTVAPTRMNATATNPFSYELVFISPFFVSRCTRRCSRSLPEQPWTDEAAHDEVRRRCTTSTDADGRGDTSTMEN